ncbi:MAG TPA: M1 family aminopeptidase [Desulfuromonadaceae bacterium]
MKHRLLQTIAAITALAALLASSLAACAASPPPAVLHQEIAVTLVPESHLLTGESTIVAAGGAHGIRLALSPAAVVERVTVGGAPASHTFRNGSLEVELPGHGETVTVRVAYRAAFNDPAPAHPVAGEDPTYGVNGTITPQGAFLGGSAGWYPVPRAIPERRTVRVTAPAGFEAVTAGRRTARSTGPRFSQSTWEERHPVGALSLSAGPYRITERRVGDIDLLAYLFRDDADLAARYLDAAERYIRFYSGLFGPYPFEKFAVVENFFPTGYGFPSYTLLGGAIIRLPFIIDTSFPHEIAHNWWGNGVLVDDRRGNWCEGLVTYLADYLLKERASADEVRDYRLRMLTDFASLVPPDRDFPLVDFAGRVDAASRAIGYDKGAMLFHMVRTLVGDDAFFGALRDICRERMYRVATWHDFIRAFSRRAGRDIGPFMEQWLTRTAGPRLSLAEVTRRRQGSGWVVSGTIVQAPPFYRIPVPLRLDTAGEPARTTVAVSGERTPFTLAAADPPRQLLLDPGADLFRLLSPAELPPTVNRIKGAERLLLVRTGECRATDESLGLLLESLGRPGTPVVPEERLDKAGIDAHDLLFCGVPRNTALLRLPGLATVSPGSFTIRGERYSGRDDLLFLAFEHPTREGRAAALFLPLSPEAAGRYGTRITHYGAYGYLVFSNGENRRKGMVPATAPGTRVVFGRESP